MDHPNASMGDYEVFLSFRGPDTRQGFTDVLYDRMDMAGIRVFRDDDELAIGDKLECIFGAIKSSKICIPIFSPKFAESKWCLSEVSRMVELKKTIVPVFYKVTSDDVKLKTSLYSDDLKKLEERYGNDEVDKWKIALIEAVSNKGRTLGANKGYIEFSKEFVEEVLSKLGPRKRFEIDNFVGVDNKQAAMVLMEMGSSEVVYIGIYGMGGIGKTTIAKLIYNEFSSSFDHCSFIAEFSRSGQIPAKFKNKKVLLILDDVDSYDQIKEIAREPGWFGSGSRIILTTRDKNVLQDYEKESGSKIRYLDMKELEHGSSLELFSRCAFGKNSPPSSLYPDLSERAVAHAGGLPLAITVIAKYLRNQKEAAVWEEIIERLKKTPPKEVKEKLLISYEALEDEQKTIFLDIACLFIDEEYTETSNVFYMWQDCNLCPRWSLEILQSRSLVKVDEDNGLWMHDQLRDMGRDIVRKKSGGDLTKQSRLWETEEILNVLKCKEKKKKNIEALKFNYYSDNNFTSEESSSFDSLKFLTLGYSRLQGRFSGLVPELRWFQCRWILEAGNFVLSKLVVLDLSDSDVNEYWEGWSQIQVLKKLKVLDLSCCEHLTQTPVFAEHMVLESLNLANCSNLAYIDPSIGKLHSLRELKLEGTCITSLPDSIGSLAKLQLLDLQWCRSLTDLPQSIQVLKKLKVLDLSCCEHLTQTPVFAEHMVLESLNLANCSNLAYIDPSIGKLHSLRELKLEGTCITSLPDSIGSLAKLQLLDLQWCRSLTDLPQSIQVLKKLKVLDLSCCEHLTQTPVFAEHMVLESLNLANCSNLAYIDPSIGKLHSLRELKLEGTCITSLPDSIGSLAKLQLLDLQWCRSLTDLPQSIQVLKKLKVLDLSCCEHLTQTPVFAEHMVLESLNLANCSNLAYIDPSIGKLHSLRELKLEGTCITSLPDSIGSLAKLQLLDLQWCRSLTDLPQSIQVLKKLKVLDLSCCEHLTQTPVFAEHMVLESLNLANCSNLAYIDPSIGKLHSLRELKLEGTCITSLPDSIGSLAKLQLLDLQWCRSLTDLPQSIQVLKKLKVLHLSYCKNLRQTPVFAEHMVLESLNLANFFNLAYIDPSIGKLHSLRGLNLEHTCITSLPDSIGSLAKLELLDLQWCRSLTDLPQSIQVLKKLKVLHLCYCKNLRQTPVFAEHMVLESLNLANCFNLAYIDPSIGKLHSLRELNLEHTCITSLPDSIGSLAKLKLLDLQWCIYLTDLPQSIQVLKKLKVLHLCYCKNLRQTPVFAEHMVLESLNLANCFNLAYIDPSIGKLHSLRELNLEHTCITSLPDSIGSLAKLKLLDLQWCIYLTDLPQSIQLLKKLKGLHLSWCENLRQTPVFTEHMAFESLVLGGCSNLVYIDPSIGKLQHLKDLNLEKTCITSLPDSIGRPVKLERLNLEGCESLIDLPQSLGNLRSLVRLDILFTKITGLPESFGDLTSLVDLDVSGSEIAVLPSTINKFSLLQTLKLYNCHHLQELPELPTSLTELKVKSDVLNKVPDLSNLLGLTSLELIAGDSILDSNGSFPSNCKLQSLTVGGLCISALPDLSSHCSQLTALTLERLHSLEVFPNLSGLRKLLTLRIESCPELIEIPGIGKLHRLTSLHIRDCPSLVNLENLRELQALRKLELFHCEKLTEIPGHGELRQLTKVCVQHCHSFKGLEALGDIEEINLIGCPGWTRLIVKSHALVKVPILSWLSNLRDLKLIDGSHWMEQKGIIESSNLKGIVSLTKLENLELRISNIRALPLDLSGLSALSSLVIVCPSFKCRPLYLTSSLQHLELTSYNSKLKLMNLSHLRNLESLVIGGHTFTDLSELQLLESLNFLTLQNCRTPSSDSLPPLKNLIRLELIRCRVLTEISSLRGLDSLEALHIELCESLERIGNLFELKKVVKVTICCCPKLHIEPYIELVTFTHFSQWLGEEIKHEEKDVWELIKQGDLKTSEYLAWWEESYEEMNSK